MEIKTLTEFKKTNPLDSFSAVPVHSRGMSKTTVIYHSADFDGIFCREIARKFLPPDTEFIGWNYGDALIPFPMDGTVYVLDLSPECFTLTADLLPMRSDAGFDGTYNRLIWIDHHKSAIDKFPTYIAGYRIDGVSACRLAWQWFDYHAKGLDGHRNQLDPNLPAKQDFIDHAVTEPFAVRLAGEYDIWDKRDERAELFQHGLRSQELSEMVWERLLNPSKRGTDGTVSGDMVEHLLQQGKAIQFAKTNENASIIKAAGFTIEFEGLKFLACNHARYNSHLFTAGLTPEHDGCFGFAWRDGKWNISLYHAPGKEHHDLSLIAVKHGGGGHRGACGFQMEKLPFI